MNRFRPRFILGSRSPRRLELLQLLMPDSRIEVRPPANSDEIGFEDLFDPEEGRMGVAVTFIAILELLRETVIEVVQAEEFSPLHVRAAASVRLVADDTADLAEDNPL